MRLGEAQLRAQIAKLFQPGPSISARAIGVELELIPVDMESKARICASPADRSRTVTAFRELQRKLDWTEQDHGEDPPSWIMPDGACISFEPGGQIEISSAPAASASSMIRSVTSLVQLVRDAMTREGIELLTLGVDPYNPIDAVPLQLNRERYAGMTRYFDSLGPSGIQMMRQTAALQINVERGNDPVARWQLVNSLAPFLLALFANSQRYAGEDTGWASYRSYFWRTLDPSRTGIVGVDDDTSRQYFEFAMEAFAMHGGGERSRYQSFRDYMNGGTIDDGEWQFHLSTLFPEVRAKDYFELRSADTIDPDQMAAPIVFVTGLIYDEQSARIAKEILPRPNLELLERAGRMGLIDRTIRDITGRLAIASLDGASSLGEEYLSPEHIETARQYFEQKLSLD